MEAAKGDESCEIVRKRPRASGWNIAETSIVLWNMVYLERAITAIRQIWQTASEEALAHLSPLTWERISLTGNYHWRKDAAIRNRKLRPLRTGRTP